MPKTEAGASVPTPAEEHRYGRIVLVGYGRVGSLVGQELKSRGRSFTVIEERGEMAEAAKLDGAEVIIGNAVDDKILRSAELENAAKLIVAIPEGFDAGQIVQRSEEHTSELQSLMRNSYAVFCLKKKKLNT